MAQPALRPARYEDLRELPDHVVGEIIGGALHVSPRPASRHAIARGGLLYDLVGPFQRGRGGPGGWLSLAEPELHLGGDVLVPDLAGWRRERMPHDPDVSWFELPPDWICEVISPSTQRIDRAHKLPTYARAGVPWLWLADPQSLTIEVYDLSASPWGLLGVWEGRQKVRLPPFDAVELDLDLIWARPAPEDQG
ncbi:MAG: Uma2 family endonuclease [Alphaproteobacteria bacterium]|nr:Uma2 family endonuclease [Alphaproteobacteria bacterium]